MSDPTQLPRFPRFTVCGLGEVRSRSRESTFSHVVSIWDVGTRGDGPAEVAAFFPATRLYQVRFDDVEMEAAGAVTRSMVRDILQFGAGLGPDDLCEPTTLAADSSVDPAGRCVHFEIWNTGDFEIVQAIECREIVGRSAGVYWNGHLQGQSGSRWRAASSNRVRTNRTPLALGAEFPEVELVDPVHEFPQVTGILGQEAGLEVALVGTLRPEAGTGQVGGF